MTFNVIVLSRGGMDMLSVKTMMWSNDVTMEVDGTRERGDAERIFDETVSRRMSGVLYCPERTHRLGAG